MSGFYASKSTGTSGGGGGGGVTTLNSLSGALTLAGGSNVSITDNGTDTITIDAMVADNNFVGNALSVDVIISSPDKTGSDAPATLNLYTGQCDLATPADISLSPGYNTAGDQGAIYIGGSNCRIDVPVRIKNLTATARDAWSYGPSPGDTPQKGQFLYNLDLNKLQVWTGAAWETITST